MDVITSKRTSDNDIQRCIVYKHHSKMQLYTSFMLLACILSIVDNALRGSRLQSQLLAAIATTCFRKHALH